MYALPALAICALPVDELMNVLSWIRSTAWRYCGNVISPPRARLRHVLAEELLQLVLHLDAAVPRVEHVRGLVDRDEPVLVVVEDHELHEG